MDVRVLNSRRNILEYKNCETVQDLRDLIAKDTNFCGHKDIRKWKLFYLGLQLDDKTTLASLADDLTTEPYINLVEPTEPVRIGTSRQQIKTIISTKFLVTGSKEAYKVYAIRPNNDIASYEFPLEYFFCGNKKFGLITNIEDQENMKERKIRCENYKLDMNAEGYVMLWEDPNTGEDRSPSEVRLVTDHATGKFKVLEPVKKKTYDEKNMTLVNTHMKEILEEFSKEIPMET